MSLEGIKGIVYIMISNLLHIPILQLSSFLTFHTLQNVSFSQNTLPPSKNPPFHFRNNRNFFEYKLRFTWYKNLWCELHKIRSTMQIIVVRWWICEDPLYSLLLSMFEDILLPVQAFTLKIVLTSSPFLLTLWSYYSLFSLPFCTPQPWSKPAWASSSSGGRGEESAKSEHNYQMTLWQARSSLWTSSY